MANALFRDIIRKRPESSRAVRRKELDRYCKGANQKRQDTNKIYRLHEPDVCCISKGTERKKYECRAKAAVVMAKPHCIIGGAKSFRDEYDGSTLKGVLVQISAERFIRAALTE